MTAPLVVISEGAFVEAPTLRRPLNDGLREIQSNINALNSKLGLETLGPIDLVVASNTPGTAPWPLQLSFSTPNVVGVFLVSVQNLTSPTSIPTSPISLTQWSAEGGTIFVGFIAGLTLSSEYRLTFGVYYAK